ncbi:MAG: Sb-PDE family phosphodiesterase [Cytophagales bacterium]|nr:Sb-PDE family phosphodiesterase [Cytophagales bacterium]
MRSFIFFLVVGFQITGYGQQAFVSDADRIIEFPDIPGYKTLKCDFHQHTVFSDGSVWPNIRVQEAIKDGLDAISITDHIEYQPHKADIPHPDRNRSYEVALEAVEGHDLIIINGSEITRDMPPGHSNAIFLEDVNRLNVKDSIEAYREAKKQGAFIFWNHPHWTAQQKTGMATLTETHKMLIEQGLLDGIEVVNDVTYSDEALQIALDHDLAILGTSDIHGLIDWQYGIPRGGHRPVTLVFAKEKSKEGIREALNQRRTAAWFNNLIIGKEAHVKPLIMESLKVTKAAYRSESSVLELEIQNLSDAEYLLENLSSYTLHDHANVIAVKPHKRTTLLVKTVKIMEEVKLPFRVLNVVTAPKTNPDITLSVKVQG